MCLISEWVTNKTEEIALFDFIFRRFRFKRITIFRPKKQEEAGLGSFWRKIYVYERTIEALIKNLAGSWGHPSNKINRINEKRQ